MGGAIYLAITLISLPALSPAEGACTSFYLDNGGNPVFGANYDHEIWEGYLFVNKRGVTKTGYEAGTSGKYARWTAEYGSVTFNLAGVQLAWAGMNEAGLVISTMWLGETRSPAPDERPPLVSPFWVQYQLDTCATIEDVMANETRVRIADAVDHYLICDQTGTCAAVEFLEGKTVFYTGEAMPVNALANNPYQIQAEAWQTGQLPERERFRIAADRVASFKTTDTSSAVTYAFETLKRLSGQVLDSTPTQWSIVFDPKNMFVYFRTSRNPEIRSIDFAKLDFDCGTPVEMLDVHAPYSGDINDRLGQFTFEANLQYTLNYLEKCGGTDISALEVEVLERGVTSFPCERPAAPYQEEKNLLISPKISWAAMALIHRLWPIVIVLVTGIVALVVWRVRTRRRHE